MTDVETVAGWIIDKMSEAISDANPEHVIFAPSDKFLHKIYHKGDDCNKAVAIDSEIVLAAWDILNDNER